MKKILLILIAAKIELHWWCITRARREGRKLIESGCSLSSSRLLSLNRNLSRHSARAMRAQQQYERLSEPMYPQERSTSHLMSPADISQIHKWEA